MAGGAAEDNPVYMNIVPLVDVIFCLCVFFMCSFKFKQIEGAFDSWLPRDKGMSGTPGDIQEIRIAMYWESDRQRVRRQFGHRVVENDEELLSLMQGADEDFKRKGKLNAPVIIDGDPRVPWSEVVKVINLAKRIPIDNIEFALGKADQ